LRQQIGGVEVPGMIDARQSVRHTVGSHHCRSLMRWLPAIASGRHLRLPVLNTVGTSVGVRSAAVINACGSKDPYFLTRLIAYTGLAHQFQKRAKNPIFGIDAPSIV
jgi:hypothetical protein